MRENAIAVIPRVVDNDRDEITVTYEGRMLRAWIYQNEPERKMKIRMAREYVEGWCDGYDLLQMKGEGA